MFKSRGNIYKETFNFAIMDIFIICFIIILGSILYSSVFGNIYFDFTDQLAQFSIIFLILLIFFNFRKLEVTLYSDYIEARYGLISKKVLLANVNSISKYKYSFWEFMGWGIRLGFSGKVAYNIPGDKFSGILINYNSKGKIKEFFISLRNTDELNKKLEELNTEFITDL